MARGEMHLDWDWDSRIFSYVIPQIERASEQGLDAAGRKAVADADVPVRSGALRRSGRSDVTFPMVTITFGTTGHDETGRATSHYAIPNHENMSYRHPRGGSAKFLTRQLHPGHELLDVLARHIRRVIDRE